MTHRTQSPNNQPKESATPRADTRGEATDRTDGMLTKHPQSTTIVNPAAIALLTSLIAGSTADQAAIAALPEPWHSLVERVAKADGQGRLPTLKAAVSSWPNASDVLRAVLAADLDAPPPGGTSWADLDQAIGPVTFAWQGWLPVGLLTILAGETGTGKSALMLRIAASLLLGWPWPDGTPYTGGTSKVLWCEAEAAQAINLDRAKRWGLPLDRILTPLADPLADVQLDTPEHRQAVQVAAQRPDVGLIIVDSLRAAQRGDENSSEQVELVLWLAALARDNNKPVLLSHHLRKRGLQDTGDAVTLDRLRGSSAIVQPARIVWALDCPNPLSPERKRLSVIKSNIARFPTPLGLSISDAGVEFGIAPEPPRTETKTDRGCDLLKSLLSHGPMQVTELEREAKSAGISWDTIKRAKERLGIVATRDGRRKVWTWALPLQGLNEQ